ncbi:asparagine synthase (glutamine-hydrolysing) [Thermanaeromonas toyohensis ToBE]|uniref:asparagine synthase (glutamine-hydrolyzing) n=1 Tax=Thermanaeromonas toyohensis ToBE TaxID=698762 RepID=A0A1W1W141_9FIRM|nr:asparagine synthase (glutamine-hydrolyzing) [Thermanaeromonas toyohensis]SMB99296.1 asparagine synthase (glutamine-hydrolysing) [Thermanaeromonas toyohensis ToBE]
MCGICGWIDWEVDLTQHKPTLEAMLETLRCRGPDAWGMWLSPRAALGHRRLIVIDPEGGSQPMVRTRGEDKYIITYNGELYNMLELRRELEARGYLFKTRSDTEIILVAFLEWGIECVKHFNGIFAFAIWSEKDQSLFLARDHLGVKPLFYAHHGSAFLFGSELKSLLAHPAVLPKIDAEGLAEIFMIGPARTPGLGVFKGIVELKPGHCLLYNPRGISIYRYWKLESHPHLDDLKTTVMKVRELLKDSVERQLISDVPLCTLLSGGIDSSAITALASKALQRIGSQELKTYSIDYAGNEIYFKPNDFEPHSDNIWVKRVASFLGTHHHTVVVDTPELVEALTAAVRARDLPGMADIDSSLYLFCREIKKGASVGLSGECADEVFGGYPWFRRKEALSAETFPWSLKLEERIRLLSPELIKKIRPQEYVADRYREALAEVPRLPGEDPFNARLREIFYLTLTRWMPTLLDRNDRMSMAVGLELRVPFCDYRLVEYVWNVPWSMKYINGQEKGLLRLALKGLLPEDVLLRRKSPYPKTHNPAFGEAIRSWVSNILNQPNSPILPLVNTAAIRTLIQFKPDFDLPWFGQLMRLPQLLAYLVQIDFWLREYRVTIC